MSPDTMILASLAPSLQAADTVFTVVARDALDTAAAVSAVVVGVFFLLLVPALLVVLSQLRRLNGTVRRLGEEGLRRADPLLESGRGIADNVEFISDAVRTDVERLSGTVKVLTERLRDASDRMEERIQEFNALMEVVQVEAEDILLDTAATVHGVRASARTLGRPSSRREASSPGAASETRERPAAGVDEEDAHGRGETPMPFAAGDED